MRTKFGLLIGAIGLLSSTGWSQEYTVTNLGTLGGNYSVGFSVNDAGQVAGRSELPTIDGVTPIHPFLYSNGAMIDLGTLGGVNGGADGVNQKGDVTGYAESTDGVAHAFLWNGAMQDLDPQNQSAGGHINATDAVVGLEGDPQAGATGVLYSGGAVQVIPHAPFNSLSPSAINDSGQISGTCFMDFRPNRACLITGGTIKSLPPLFGKNTFSEGYAINAAGDVCGVSFPNPPLTSTATLWSGGAKVNLGQLPNGTKSECEGLNDFGQQVGNAIPHSGTALRAVSFDVLNGARNLNLLIAHTPSLVLTQATAISNTGYIVVVCQYGGTHAKTRACLLKPNAVLILKKNIFALEQNDPGCIACKAVLDPEASSLPDTLVDISPEQQKRVVATVDSMIVQLRRLERAGQITAPQAKLLVHQSQLVLAGLRET